MVIRNMFLWNKERNYYKNMNFAQKESSFYEEKKSLWILGKGKVDVTGFWEQKEIFFNAGSW